MLFILFYLFFLRGIFARIEQQNKPQTPHATHTHTLTHRKLSEFNKWSPSPRPPRCHQVCSLHQHINNHAICTAHQLSYNPLLVTSTIIPSPRRTNHHARPQQVHQLYNPSNKHSKQTLKTDTQNKVNTRHKTHKILTQTGPETCTTTAPSRGPQVHLPSHHITSP